MNEFLQRLKERKLVQWTVAYCASAFALVQLLDIVAQRFDWPEYLVRFTFIALAVGFFVTLVLAWYHGERGAQRVGGTELLILALLLALGGGFLWRFAGAAHERIVRPAPTLPSPLPAAIPEKSIAVLPFENLSDEKANAYFVGGIQDEILTRLSKIADLKVISRTSTLKYKSAPENLREVGSQLGVAHLLEGSVQKAGDQVHINVQLINAATDAHLWAESYDRELKNIFSVEGEVAGAIAEALKAKLTGSEKKAIAEKPTQNAAAYEAYLRGLALEHNEYSFSQSQQAADDYAEAVRLDPKFARAWARLGVIRSFLYFNTIALQTNTPVAVKEAADRAIALAPEAGESWIALGYYRYRVQRDFSGALAAFEKAQKLLPNSSLVWNAIGTVERRLGRWEEAEASFEMAKKLDPRDVTLLNGLGVDFYKYLRRYDDAKAALEQALKISPDSESTRANLAAVLQSQGRLDESARQLARIPADSIDHLVVSARVNQELYERHFDAAIKLVEQTLAALPPGQPLDSDTTTALVNLGYAQEWSGRKDEARRAFTRVVHELRPTPETIVAPEANATPETLALAYAGLGEKQEALEQAKSALAFWDGDAVSRPAAEVALAQIQAHFGDTDSAIAALPHLLEVPAGVTQADLRFNPLWDPLRQDARFQELLKASATADKGPAR